jgi:hypothetical protein
MDLQYLSKEAKELLIEASKDPHGTVIKILNPVTGDISLKTNGKNLVMEVGPKVKALWESALQELLVNTLLAEKGENVFEITHKGYQSVDKLNKKNNNRGDVVGSN